MKTTKEFRELTEGQLAEYFSNESIDEDDIDIILNGINIAERNNMARRFENTFAKKCRQKGWVIQRGNTLAAYYLKPNIIKDKQTRKDLILISRSIRLARVKTALSKLFIKFKSESQHQGEIWIRIRGLPDFIILTQFNKKPYWVEVKSVTSKMRPSQKLMKKYLEDIGFEVFEYWGLRFSLFENLLRNKS